jgi:hypothetical protein
MGMLEGIVRFGNANAISRALLTRLVLVFPLNLKDIKEVGCRGVDLD